MEPASDWQPDTNVPNAARIYDYLLDGRDNFGPDRELADRMQAEAGDGDGVRELAKINRRFVLSASRWCASMLGVDQFLDCGCGLPLVPAVHDAARQGCPDATVVYADKDAKVISHVETMCWAGEGLAAVAADASDPVAVLAGAAALLDLARPVAVIFGGTLSAMGADVARNAVQGFTEALAPGSAIVISCASFADPELGQRMERLFGAAGPWLNHDRETVEAFFVAANLRLVRGRAADVKCWPMVHPETPAACVIGGIGVKP